MDFAFALLNLYASIGVYANANIKAKLFVVGYEKVMPHYKSTLQDALFIIGFHS